MESDIGDERFTMLSTVMQMFEFISRLWRKKPFYLVTVIEDCPYWAKIHTLQFPECVSRDAAMAMAENWRKHACPSKGWICSRVEREVRWVWHSIEGQKPIVPSSYQIGRHTCRQRATPVVAYST